MSAKEIKNPEISVIIPVYNEEKNVELVYLSLKKVMKGLGKEYEILFIDDGSSDHTFKILKGLHERKGDIRVIRFRRNFGQTAAMAAGFDYARGEVIVTIDGDLQNDPEDIPRLLAKMKEGYDIVSGWRVDRQDATISRKIPSLVANWLIGKITGVPLHDYGCTLKAYRAEVIKNVRLYGEMHRFIPALASWVGARVMELKVKHYSRKYGQSKYGLSRTIRVILDLIAVKFLLSFSTKPIQIFGLLGFLSALIGFLLGAYLTVLKLVYQESIGHRPLLMLAILLLVLGVQFISIGLLGEIMVRTYHESQHKPIYVVKEIVE